MGYPGLEADKGNKRTHIFGYSTAFLALNPLFIDSESPK